MLIDITQVLLIEKKLCDFKAMFLSVFVATICILMDLFFLSSSFSL